MKNKSIKVIFDTNVLISFLIGKRLSFLKEYISSEEIVIIYCKQLLQEIKEVTTRPKLKKYFPKNAVVELIDLIETIGVAFEIEHKTAIVRDAKDNFLIDLAEISKADYLVTGDKDLLLHHPFKTTSIITPKEFEDDLLK